MTERRQIWIRIITGIAGLILAAVCAHIQDWKPSDLIWGFWGSSLIVGYLWIIAYFVTTLILALSTGTKKEDAIGDAVAGIVVMSLHFLAVHYFLSLLLLDASFPLLNDSGDRCSFIQKVWVVLQSYWGLILASFVAQCIEFPSVISNETEGQKKKVAKDDIDPIWSPYRVAVKMCIMMFVLLGYEFSHAPQEVGESSRFVIYTILVLFFFPWKSLGVNFGLGKKNWGHRSSGTHN